LKNSKEQLY